MPDPLITTLVILSIATILFLTDRLSADLVALLVVVALSLLGVLTPQEALSGFSRSAVITLLAIFTLAEGLRRTGVTERIGRVLVRVAGDRESRLVAAVMLAGAFLSLFMNNIAAAAVLLPAITGAARRSQIKASRLLMPLAFATILGGMATLLTTTNIVASSLLRDEGLPGYGLLDFLPLGLPILLVGLAYMVTLGRRWLPSEEVQTRPRPDQDLVDLYRLGERLVRARVLSGGPLVGATLATCRFRESLGLSVVAVEHAGQMMLSPSPKIKFSAGDVLTLEGRTELVPWEELKGALEVLPVRRWGERDLESSQVAVIEVVLAPRSSLIGQTLKEVSFREKYGMVVLAIWRNGHPRRSNLVDLPLEFGDALLLQGPRGRLKILADEPDVILLNAEEGEAEPLGRRGVLAVGIMLGSLAAAVWMPDYIAEIMLAGGLLMVLFRLLSMEQTYRAIEWKSVFLVAGMLPMGLAISKTGAGELAAEKVIAVLGGGGPLLLLAGLFLLTMLLAQVMHSAAVAAVMVPVAIHVAQGLGLEPRAMVMGVTLATSMAFLTPLGHPVNVLVMGPGGYRFKDYFRVGMPLTVLLFGVVMVLLPVIWPF